MTGSMAWTQHSFESSQNNETMPKIRVHQLDNIINWSLFPVSGSINWTDVHINVHLWKSMNCLGFPLWIAPHIFLITQTQTRQFCVPFVTVHSLWINEASFMDTFFSSMKFTCDHHCFWLCSLMMKWNPFMSHDSFIFEHRSPNIVISCSDGQILHGMWRAANSGQCPLTNPKRTQSSSVESCCFLVWQRIRNFMILFHSGKMPLCT